VGKGGGGGRICGEASSVATVFEGEDSCWMCVRYQRVVAERTGKQTAEV
jgi:hypothetical protein